jgi:hypothetical protein
MRRVGSTAGRHVHKLVPASNKQSNAVPSREIAVIAGRRRYSVKSRLKPPFGLRLASFAEYPGGRLRRARIKFPPRPQAKRKFR